MTKCKVTFLCRCLGRNPCIVGNCEELGNWNPLKGARLEIINEGKGEYKSSGLKLPKGQIEFKIVHLGEDPPVWEILPFDKNRIIDTTNEKDILVRFAEDQEPLTIAKKKPEKIQSMDETDEKFSKKITVRKDQNIIIASLHLPLVPVKNAETGKWILKLSNRMMYPMLYEVLMRDYTKVKWVGYWNPPSEATDEEVEMIEEMLKNNNCYVVHLQDRYKKLFFHYYETVLYPFFHNFVCPTDNFEFTSNEYWMAYFAVNKAIAGTMMNLCTSTKDTVFWVNDMHLLMCPLHLVQMRPSANIGLFLHTSFPTSEIYRIFPHRQEILRSMLCCNIIGFHLFSYARNFIVSCRRILGITHVTRKGFLYLEAGGRMVFINVQHLGIEIGILKQILENSEEFKKEYASLKERCAGMHIIGSTDRPYSLSGVYDKLVGYEGFLKKFPSFRKNTKLIQYMFELPITDYPPPEFAEEKKYAQQIAETYGENTIEFLTKNISKEKRWALMAVSDTWIITSLRQGYTLFPLEYIAVRGILGLSHGELIVSSFSGSIPSLVTATTINPYNNSEITKAIEFVRKENIENKRAKFLNDFEKVSVDTVSSWIERWVGDIIRADNDSANSSLIKVGMRETFQLLKMRKDFYFLDSERISMIGKALSKGKNRLIIVDNEGTISPADPHKGNQILAGESFLEKNAKNILEELSQDPHNTVCVISGRNPDEMQKKFSKIPGIWIVAENGFYYARNDLESETLKYQQLTEMKDTEWKALVLSIMNDYKEKTEGSFINSKQSCVSWIFRDVDTDFAIKQANELMAHLYTLLEFMPVEIAIGKDYVEVKPKGVNKGAFVTKFLQLIQREKGPIDFIFCMGDDETDEEMFRAIKDYPKSERLEKACFCVTVGQKTSLADFYVDEYSQSINALIQMMLPSVSQIQRALPLVRKRSEDLRGKYWPYSIAIPKGPMENEDKFSLNS